MPAGGILTRWIHAQEFTSLVIGQLASTNIFTMNNNKDKNKLENQPRGIRVFLYFSKLKF
jgi:hypothetical protein